MFCVAKPPSFSSCPSWWKCFVRQSRLHALHVLHDDNLFSHKLSALWWEILISNNTSVRRKHHLFPLVAIAMIFFTGLLIRGVNLTEEIPPKKPFDSFPMEIGEWSGEKGRFDERIYDALGVDDSILGSYRTSQGDLVQLYVGYYHSQKKGDLIHSPKNCMPGSGWNITEFSVEEVGGEESADTFKAIKLLIENGGEQQVVLYWFQSRGRIISSEYMQKIYLVIDSIFKRRTDGSFVRLISPVQDGNLDATTQKMKVFAHDLAPYLHAYIPS